MKRKVENYAMRRKADSKKDCIISGVQTDRHSRLVVRYVAYVYRIPRPGV